MNTTDIVGAQAGWKPLHRRARLEAPPHNLLDIGISIKNSNPYADLTKTPKNLLDPHYHVNGIIIIIIIMIIIIIIIIIIRNGLS
jgi:hypothetical protein